MSLTIPRNYSAGATLTKAQLDAAFDAVETKFNTTLITGSEITDATITADELAANSVTTVKINDLAVNTAKLAADAVTTAKILDANVTTAKLAANAVTRAKLEAVGQQASSTSGFYSTSSTSYVDVTNLSVSITTTGRPVLVVMVPSTVGNTAIGINSSAASHTAYNGYLKLLRGATMVGSIQVFDRVATTSDQTTRYVGWTPLFYDAPSAGTYTYKVQAMVDQATTSLTVNEYLLLAYEL